MTVNEIFSELSAHMIKGVMIHEQLSDYYDFLNLHGYKRCHEYRSKHEMCGLRRLHRYFINHYNKLIEEKQIEDPAVIPSSWYKYTRQEVDTNTKRSAVKTGIEKWVEWEVETKDLYQRMYKELLDMGEIASANKISCYICEVDRELKQAYRKHLNLVSIDYNIGSIVAEQDKLHDKYKRKMNHEYDKRKGS